jgi:hypothetical protein
MGSSFSKKAAPSSPANETAPCRLLDLPPELRNLIWEFATTITVHVDRDEDEPDSAHAPSCAGLLLSCRQIRDEALLIYYHSATFQFTHPGPGCGWFRRRKAEHRFDMYEVRFDLMELIRRELGRYLESSDGQMEHWVLHEVASGNACERADRITFLNDVMMVNMLHKKPRDGEDDGQAADYEEYWTTDPLHRPKEVKGERAWDGRRLRSVSDYPNLQWNLVYGY